MIGETHSKQLDVILMDIELKKESDMNLILVRVKVRVRVRIRIRIRVSGSWGYLICLGIAYEHRVTYSFHADRYR